METRQAQRLRSAARCSAQSDTPAPRGREDARGAALVAFGRGCGLAALARWALGRVGRTEWR
eukprot:10765296-Alexandrium_andersonii.AAC.1